MSHLRINFRDIEFNLFEVLDVTGRRDPGDGNAIDIDAAHAVLTEARELAAGSLAESYLDAEREPIGFDRANHAVVVPDSLRGSVKALQDSRWSALGLPAAMGGMEVPAPLRWAVEEMLIPANRAAHFFNLGPALHGILYSEGTRRQQQWARHAWANRWGSTMVRAEPDVGSDMGMTRTTAVRQPNGAWHLSGVRRFVSGGDLGDTADNILHLVLAHPEGSTPGVAGLSLFVVPKILFDVDTMRLDRRNGVYATSLERVMGLRSAPICELTFGAHHPAIGYLVGEVHNGMAQLGCAMDSMRMGIGATATGTLSSGYLHTLDFARSRGSSADPMQNEHRGTPWGATVGEPEVRRSLMLQKSYAEGLRALYLYCAAYQDRRLAGSVFDAGPELATRVNELLLPLVKGICSQRAYEVLAESLQTFGAARCLQEYPIGQYVRDVRVDTLFEGTTAVHAQEFFFDRIIRDEGVALRHVTTSIARFIYTSLPRGRFLVERELLAAALVEFHAMVATLRRGMVDAMNAPTELYRIGLVLVRFFQAAGDLLIAWRLLEQANVALTALDRPLDAADRSFYSGKIAAAAWFIKNRLPLLTATRTAIDAVDLDLMLLDDAYF